MASVPLILPRSASKRIPPRLVPLSCRTCGYEAETRIFVDTPRRPPHCPYLVCPKCGCNPERVVPS